MIREGEEADEPAFKALVRQAVAVSRSQGETCLANCWNS
jgi:hypothetical protein